MAFTLVPPGPSAAAWPLGAPPGLIAEVRGVKTELEEIRTALVAATHASGVKEELDDIKVAVAAHATTLAEIKSTLEAMSAAPGATGASPSATAATPTASRRWHRPGKPHRRSRSQGANSSLESARLDDFQASFNDFVEFVTTTMPTASSVQDVKEGLQEVKVTPAATPMAGLAARSVDELKSSVLATMPTASAVQEVKDGLDEVAHSAAFAVQSSLAEFKSSVLEAMLPAKAVQEVKSGIDDLKATLAAAPNHSAEVGAAMIAGVASSFEEFKSSFLTTVPTHSAVQEIKDGLDEVKNILGATPMATSAAHEVKRSLEEFKSSFETLSLRAAVPTTEAVHDVKATVEAVQVDTQAIRQSLQAPPRSGLRRSGSNATLMLPMVEGPQR